MNIKKPDFFIVGAPKCGTTALNEYLRAHPEIYIPDRKELHFFGSDLESKTFLNNLETYLSYFSSWKEEKRGGEASVWYLYSQRAAKEIAEFAPCASIIIMLRNPVDMLYSNYYQFLYNGNEDLPSFKQALNAELDRKNGKSIPKTAHFVQGLFYTETVKFAEQVQRYFNVFGRENVFIIIYDDFKNDISRVYKETLIFLGVSTEFQPEFKIINPNKSAKSRLLRNFLHSPPTPVQALGKLLLPKNLNSCLKNKLKSFNTQYAPRPPMNPELCKQLTEKFKPEVERLSHLLNRDLTYWYR